MDRFAGWGGIATRSDFAGRDDLWEYCLSLQRLFAAEASQLTVAFDEEVYPIGDVELVYIANASVNALAGAWDGRECIAMFTGTAIRLMEVAHAHFPPAYANALTVIAVHYVFAHELAHLAMGHVAYLVKDQALLEYGDSAAHKRDPRARLRRFLEFEADTGAVTLSLPFVLDVVREASINPFSDRTASDADLMTLWAIAVGLVYTAMHQANPGGHSHPPPIPRYYNAMMLGAAVAARRDRDDDYLDALGVAHEQLQRMWAANGMRPRRRLSWSSIMKMDDDIPEAQQREWLELARARAARLR